jgi:ParB family chromosome partitioning protein
MSKPTKRKSIVANFGDLSSNAPSTEMNKTSEAKQAHVMSKRVGAGVIGATKRTLEDIRDERDRLQKMVEEGSGIVKIDPYKVDPSPFPDRLNDDDEIYFEAFKETLREEGQKVPVQLRKHPKDEGRYQVIYGHRRWRAAKELGMLLNALIVEMSDSDLVVAQGIENSQRQDLSWIERALFAYRMEDAGIKARDIRAALGVDDAELARFRAALRSLGAGMIEKIGRAPNIGRPRWNELVALIKADSQTLKKIEKTLSADKISQLPSNDRFMAVLNVLKNKNEQNPDHKKGIDLISSQGKPIGEVKINPRAIQIKLNKEQAESFTKYFERSLPELIEKFEKETND